jgi:hypothetical protein
MDIEEIYKGAANLINQILRKESSEQGHYLTGAMEDSFETEISKQGNKDVMDGFAVYYTQFVNDGVGPESASFKQAPFLIKYFQQRGLSEKEATGAAFATIKTWMKEGMSTQASKRFSKTGSRQNFVENALTGNEDKIDSYMNDTLDYAIDEAFNQEKTEKV